MVSVILYCVQVFWWISHKPSEKYWAILPKAKHKNSKKTLSTFQNCLFEGCSAFSLVVTEENCFENFLRSLYVEQYVFFVQMQSRVSAALVFEGYVRYFGSSHLAFEMSCDTEYLKNGFWFFRKRGLRCFVLYAICNCFDDFRTNRPKNNGRSNRKENTNFPKRRWVRSKNVCLSSALLFPSAITTKIVSRPSWDLYLEQYVFFVQMQSCVSAALVFEGYAWYFWSLHLASEMSCDIEYLWKKLLFLEENRNFQNDVEYVPEMSFWALVGWLLWL